MMRQLLITLFLLSPWALAQPAAPPGHNVHFVAEDKGGSLFWRGGSPRSDTLQALQKRAQERQRPITLIDLRRPPTRDDLLGHAGRLTPTGEAQLARGLGLRYRSISALDSDLIQVLDQALKAGDVYIHCMYGVNRTGFAVARYATAHGLKLDRKALGKRDWQEGVRFQKARNPR